MKKRNIAAAILLASMMAVSTCAVTSMTASAGATDSYTITVNESTAGYTYTAYQIFKGDVSGASNDVLSNIDWATGFNSNSFLTALTSDSLLGTNFSGVTTASGVVGVLKDYDETNDVAKLAQFAKLAKANVGSAPSFTQSAVTSDAYPITVTGSGYYLIEETNTTGATDANKHVSRYMLNVVGPATVNPKRPEPTLDKVISGPNAADSGKANNVSIGDAVNYTITTAVPDMTGYSKYFFVINDDLEAGLTFNNDVAITLGTGTSATTVEASKYTVQTASTETDGHTFQIVFNDFYTNFKDHAGDTITVTYSATLNENADRTTAGNLNTANLTYSNNPNVTPSGENEPTGTDPKGVTPDKQTKTYTANIKLHKVDGLNANLTGAKFQISGTSANVVLVNGTAYELDNSTGTYYKLKNGTFTTTEPSGDTSNYDGTDKYKVVSNVSSSTTYSNVCKEAYVDSDGYLEFGGLGAGTYTITEIVTPEGYNTINPITVVINGSGNTFASPGWTATKDGATVSMTTGTGESATPTAIVAFNVVNQSGTTLPSTGGIGTTIFYVVGGTLVAGAVVLLITKKRMNTPDQK